jgi:hypothetical protein
MISLREGNFSSLPDDVVRAHVSKHVVRVVRGEGGVRGGQKTKLVKSKAIHDALKGCLVIRLTQRRKIVTRFNIKPFLTIVHINLKTN